MARYGRPELRWSLQKAPATEPLAADLVKQHRRLDADDTSQDSIITMLIAMAREYAEAYTGQALMQQQWRIGMDGFPGVVIPPTPFAAVAAWLPTPQPSPDIHVGKSPLQAVDSITYTDANGATQTLDPATYIVDNTGIVPRISLARGKVWPATIEQIGSVNIAATFGYASADAVPAGIKHWMLVRVGTMFENREEVAVMSRGRIDPLPFMDSLLDPYKVPRL